MVCSTEKCQIYDSFSFIIGRDYRADRYDNHRRETFQKELVGAVNKLRAQYRLFPLIREGTSGPNVRFYLHYRTNFTIVDHSLMMGAESEKAKTFQIARFLSQKLSG